MVGYNTGVVSDCSADAMINISVKGEKLSAISGGICGYSNQTMTDCMFSGQVTSKVLYIDGKAYSGGICGQGKAVNCRNMGVVVSEAAAYSDAYAGGIVASATGTNENCYNGGSISAANSRYSYAGGIIGYLSAGEISGCRNDGDVYANTKYSYAETYCGGICGRNYGTISFCENRGDIDADSSSSHVRAGGVAGYNEATVEDSKNFGAISGMSTAYETHVGGVVGTSGSGSSNYVRRCVNYGTVSSTGNGQYSSGSAGGVAGLLQYGKVLQCANYGAVTGIGLADKSDCYVGGVVGGTSGGTIIDCYNHGSALQDYRGNRSYSAGACGGIYGEVGTTCCYCYNIGDLTVTSSLTSIGGIQGLGNGTSADSTESCYAIHVYDDPSAIEMTQSEAKVQSTYMGFDFENVWAIDPEINEGYPYIKTMPAADDARWYVDKTVEIPVSGIWLEHNTISLRVGDSVTVGASVLPGNASNRSLRWESSDSAVAAVTQSGTITAVATGDAVITVMSEQGELTAACTVSVSARNAHEYTIRDLSLRSINGDPISTIQNDEFYVNVQISRETDSGNALVLLVTYTAQGQMLNTMYFAVEDAPVGATVTIGARINNLAGNVGRIKAMVIPSLSVFQPLGDSVEITKE